jgi:cellulose synthase operon protein YhjQ
MPVICFASPKGGVGKTTVAANVAGELARTGMRIVALDLDPQNALRLHFGITLQDSAGFTHRLAAKPDWRRCVRETPADVSVLPYGRSRMDEGLTLSFAVAENPGLIRNQIDDILADADTCLVVDTPPGPSVLLAAILPRTDLLITVLLVDTTSISLIPTIEQSNIYGTDEPGQPRPDMGFILNQFDPRTRLGGVIADAATRHLGDRLIGMVYRDEHVAEAVAAQRLLTDYAPASKAGQDVVAISRAISRRLRLPSPDTNARRRQARP